MTIKGVKHDTGKLRWDLLPLGTAEPIVHVLTFGAVKYGPNNWKRVRPFRDRYYAALMRHLKAWQSGEKLDPETQLPHLAHAGCCLIFLLWWESK